MIAIWPSLPCQQILFTWDEVPLTALEDVRIDVSQSGSSHSAPSDSAFPSFLCIGGAHGTVRADKRKGKVFWEPLERVLIPNEKARYHERRTFLPLLLPSCLACWSTGIMSAVGAHCPASKRNGREEHKMLTQHPNISWAPALTL